MRGIEIEKVETRRELNRFIKLPWKIYQGDPHWVPPLLIDMKKILNQNKNPFFKHSAADYFLAKQSGEVVGRVAAILNNNHNKFHNEKTGFFGFFESIDDPNVAQALINKAKDWCKENV